MQDLRASVLARDVSCRWPGCSHHDEPLEMAHLQHRGMGGSKAANSMSNTLMLCKTHHDCLDGRTGLGTLRFELNEMLKHAAHIH